jgi:uncharacterized protein (TIGR03084 family)
VKSLCPVRWCDTSRSSRKANAVSRNQPLRIGELIDDLLAERLALEAVLRSISGAAWDIPTHAVGWAVRDQVAHLAATDEAAARVLTHGGDTRQSRADLIPERGGGATTDRALDRGRSIAPGELLDWWSGAGTILAQAARAADEQARITWAGLSMSVTSFLTSRLMETWSHGLDVVDVVGVERPDTDRLRHIAFLGLRTRPYPYIARGLPVPAEPISVELDLPSGVQWGSRAIGGANRIRGTAVDFCRVVSRRRHVMDTDLLVEGDAARGWMEIAQVYAGPPGTGRSPGEFKRESDLRGPNPLVSPRLPPPAHAGDPGWGAV